MAATSLKEIGKVHTWAPFHDESEARHAMITYAVHAHCADAAMVWSDATGAKLLVQGTADEDGDVKVLIAHAHGLTPPSPYRPKTPTMVESFETAAAKLLATVQTDARKTGAAIAGGVRAAAAQSRQPLGERQ